MQKRDVRPTLNRYLAAFMSAAASSLSGLPVPTLDAALLAGGYSRRMGRDKALLPADRGRELWRVQWEKLGELAPLNRWLSVRRDQTWVPAGIPVVYDDVIDAGPITGIAATLRASRASHVAVLAVDMPRLPAAWFERLFALCRPGVGAVGKHSGANGGLEPLAAIYPRSWIEFLSRAIQRNQRAIQPLIEEAIPQGAFRVQEILTEQAVWFENWNAPADMSG